MPGRGRSGKLRPPLWSRPDRRSAAGNTGPDVSKHRERRETMKIRHAHSHGRPVNLRAFPCYGKEDWRIAERTEVIRVVRVFPQVVRVHHHVLSKRLLKASIELVPLT